MTKETVKTPWGKAQEIIEISEDITLYHAAGHGGYKISDTFQKLIPESCRVEGGWYEEDCGCLIIEYFFYDLINPVMDKAEIKEQAKEVLGLTFPDENKTIEAKFIYARELIEAALSQFEKEHPNVSEYDDLEDYTHDSYGGEILTVQDFQKEYEEGKKSTNDLYHFELFLRSLIKNYGHHLKS